MDQLEKLCRALVEWYNGVPVAYRGVVMFAIGFVIGGIIF